MVSWKNEHLQLDSGVDRHQEPLRTGNSEPLEDWLGADPIGSEVAVSPCINDSLKQKIAIRIYQAILVDGIGLESNQYHMAPRSGQSGEGRTETLLSKCTVLHLAANHCHQYLDIQNISRIYF